MDTADLLPHRAALIGSAVALMVGLTGGLILKTGSQDAPSVEAYGGTGSQYAQDAPIAWPAGAPADYVVGTDFTRLRTEPPPVVVASYNVPEYVPTAWRDPDPQPPISVVEPTERTWASTNGDILDVRLPEDAPPAPQAPTPPVAVEAPAAPVAPAAMAALQ